MITAPNEVQARCCGVEPTTGSGHAAMPMEDSPARISKIRAGTRMAPRPAAVTRWQPPTSSSAPVITHRSVPPWPAITLTVSRIGS